MSLWEKDITDTEVQNLMGTQIFSDLLLITKLAYYGLWQAQWRKSLSKCFQEDIKMFSKNFKMFSLLLLLTWDGILRSFFDFLDLIVRFIK